jgi:hypothetical protein
MYTELNQESSCREFVVVSLLMESPPIINQEGFREVKVEMYVGGPDEPVNFLPFFLLVEQAPVN